MKSPSVVRHAVTGRSRSKAAVLAVAVVLTAGTAFSVGRAAPSEGAQPLASGIWSQSTTPQNVEDVDSTGVTLGVKFSSAREGVLTGVQFYGSPRNGGTHEGKLWSASGELLGTATFGESTSTGWHTALFDTPVAITPGRAYVASYTAPQGHYADDQNSFSPAKPLTVGDLTALSGVYTYGNGVPTSTWNDSNYYVDVLFLPATPGVSSSSAEGSTSSLSSTSSAVTTRTPSPAPSSSVTPLPSSTEAAPTTTAGTSSVSSSGSVGFPGASNTGVPAGTSLTAYTGPRTITTPNTVIDSKTITGGLSIRATGVKISRSKVTGNIDSDNGGSVIISDTEVDGGTSEQAAITQDNITMTRVNVHGARQSVTCGSNCNIQDSWLHGQYLLPGSAWHVNGYISNGGSNVLLKHNTVACDVTSHGDGGCTGPAAVFGDFGPLSNITFDGNLFVQSPTGAYCLYAGYDPSKPYGSNPTGIVVKNNVFQHGSTGKCAYFGAATAFLPSASNIWTNNTWDNGDTMNRP